MPKIKVNKKKDKAKCWICDKWIEMVWNYEFQLHEITCCGVTVSINTVPKVKKY